VKHLNEQKNNARPADMGLFHENIDQYIEDSTARTLANYISSHKMGKTIRTRSEINSRLDLGFK
jgi:hypothetical protein